MDHTLDITSFGLLITSEAHFCEEQLERVAFFNLFIAVCACYHLHDIFMEELV